MSSGVFAGVLTVVFTGFNSNVYPKKLKPLLTRLRQACCHPSLIAPGISLSSTKLNHFLELVEELKENNHRALVFSQFVGCLMKARELLDEKGISYQYLDGSTSIDER